MKSRLSSTIQHDGPSAMAAESPENKKKVELQAPGTNLNFINPEKFIIQNNFIPQPSILMNQTGSGHLNPHKVGSV